MIRTKQERLQEVYAHVRANYGIHTQSDFSKSLGMTRPAISSAMNGNDSYLTDNLFKKVCATWQGVFNLDYLLTGRGALLAEQKKAAEPLNDPTADLVDLCARVIKEVEYLRKQLTEEIAEVHTLRMELSATLHQLRGQYQSPNLPTASAAETTTK